jgi:rod shape-determining protein MreD
MISELNPNARRDHFGSKINRDHSPFLALAVPWITILLASIAPMLPFIPGIAIVPPLGFMMMVAWKLMRPEQLPTWAGFPLGAFDDLFSGQPFGSAILLWSLAMIAMEVGEARFPWRNFVQDWLASGVLVATYLVMASILSGTGAGFTHIPYLLPQLLLSLMLFPIIARIIAILDRFRLLRIRRIG